MRTLWCATTYLFWQYAILWLPVLLADLTAFCLRLLQRWMTQAVINSLAAGHSVLSSNPEPVSTLLPAWTVVFGVSKVLTEFVNLNLYAAALIVTSVLIPALITQRKLSWREIVFPARQLRVQILLFSLQVFGMLAVAMFLGLELVTYLPRFRVLSMFSTISGSRAEGLALIALLFAAVAWLMAPAALALVRPPQSPPNDAKSRRQARDIAAISVLASVAIYYVTTVLMPSFSHLLISNVAVDVFWAIGSAASALPYIPLFIAFHLIANPDSRLLDTQPDPDIATDPPPEPIP